MLHRFNITDGHLKTSLSTLHSTPVQQKKGPLIYIYSLWIFDAIPGRNLSSWGFVLTPIGHTTLRRTLLDEWSARRRDFNLTGHNTHERHTFMPPTGFEPTIPANERPQTNALRYNIRIYIVVNKPTVSSEALRI